MGIDKIEGLDEFKRATSEIEKNLVDDMRESSRQYATEWVAAAQANASTSQETIAASELFVNAEGEGATIGNPSPLFYGSEFGGQGRPETMQFPPFQGQRGYWFYPARRDNEDRLNEIWGDGIDKAMEPWDRTAH